MNKQIQLDEKHMEYEGAPSGYVRLYNYKEPFMEFVGGYGYEGVLLFDGMTDKIQCHFCGNWFENLAGHISRHALNAKRYKKKVGLHTTTALINEAVREKLVASGMEKRIQNLTKRGKMSEETAVYGSIKNAIEIAGLAYRKKGEGLNKTKKRWTEKEAIEFVSDFFKKKDYLPSKTQMPSGLATSFRRKRLNQEKVFAFVIKHKGKYETKEAINGFNSQQLAMVLQNFYKQHDRVPSESDQRRLFVPSRQLYAQHFGSWKLALEAAGIKT
jgi:hypothetical protein